MGMGELHPIVTPNTGPGLQPVAEPVRAPDGIKNGRRAPDTNRLDEAQEGAPQSFTSTGRAALLPTFSLSSADSFATRHRPNAGGDIAASCSRHCGSCAVSRCSAAHREPRREILTPVTPGQPAERLGGSQEMCRQRNWAQGKD
ncbi:hypothetical protein Vretifemale_9008 [Volvox reticuliferus]|uniref:Uncharacterized protein n=1 Tax=Volvox reticuliferus TaxID=1737510 RepID=A0A8J4CBX6_9CHLO|nr:hypothetical protein Vretifemale_9008 [Volvox reticuliferus]